MSEKLAHTTSNPSISSVADSPVRTSASPDRVRAWTGSDLVFGVSSPESWASYDLHTCSWKTSQGSLLEDLDVFLETWPDSGSMRSGRVFRRAAWVRHTCDDACSLWPTPTASMDGRGFGIPMHQRSGRYKRSTVLRVQELVGKHGWRIHPNFTETLMGYPTDWTAIAPSATRSSRKSRNGSGDKS